MNNLKYSCLLKYDELCNALKNIVSMMRPLLDNKPSQKEVDKLKKWEEDIKPFRIECVRILYCKIELLQGMYDK